MPPPLRWLKDQWMRVNRAVGFAVSTILLTVFWIVVIGGYALVRKFVGLFWLRDPKKPGWTSILQEGQDMRFQF